MKLFDINLKIPIILFSKLSLAHSIDKHDVEHFAPSWNEYPQIIPFELIESINVRSCIKLFEISIIGYIKIKVKSENIERYKYFL